MKKFLFLIHALQNVQVQYCTETKIQKNKQHRNSEKALMLNFGFNSRETSWQSSVNGFFWFEPNCIQIFTAFSSNSCPSTEYLSQGTSIKSTVHLKIIHVFNLRY